MVAGRRLGAGPPLPAVGALARVARSLAAAGGHLPPDPGGRGRNHRRPDERRFSLRHPG